jgi:hypothetical protein
MQQVTRLNSATLLEQLKVNATYTDVSLNMPQIISKFYKGMYENIFNVPIKYVTSLTFQILVLNGKHPMSFQTFMLSNFQPCSHTRYKRTLRMANTK